MLKTKLVKASFFSHGALFIVIAPYHVTTKAQAGDYHNQFSDTSITTVEVYRNTLADTTVLHAADTLFVFSKNIEASPKIHLNSAASAYTKKFIKKNMEDLEAIEKRSAPYFNIIETIFRKKNIPEELKYLAVVESELKASATSRVGAKGPWQLMPSLARDFGLKVTKKYDERTQYSKSTIAAAKYLKCLYSEFGDWLLVVAAYNGGSGTVAKAIKRSGSRNFWKLQNFLPAETRCHVKRFIGTQYYFQKECSVTVLTKAEATAFLQEQEEFKIKQEIKMQQDSVVYAQE